jgi:similar to stage IV sporulation protein
LSAGIAKRAFSPQVVEKQLLLALPDLTWVNVDVKGTLATIHVAERIVPDSDLTNPGDVVAAADGVVEKLVTLRGIPMVQEGDVVAAGQLLISGLIPPRAPEHKELVEKGGVPYVRADGITLARVWREGYAEAVLLQREKVPTGRVSRQLLWQWGGRSGYLGRGADFPVYQEQTRIWQPRLAGWRLPAAIGLLERAEVEVQQRPLDPDEARESALAAAWEQVKAAMPPGAEINSPPQVEMETALEGSTPVVRVRVTVEALEDIRLFRPLAPDSAPAASRALSIQPVPGP